MTTAADRRRTALHEAGHALAACLWWPDALQVLSIRPGSGHRGIAIGNGNAAANLNERIDGRHPLDGLDPDARRDADRCLIGVLLGDATVAVFLPTLGHQPDPIGYLESATPVKLAPPVRAWLDAAEADPDPMDDDSRAFEQAFLLVGQAAVPYLAWAAFEARRLAREHAAGISAVASALLAHEILDGPTVVELFTTAQKGAPGR